MHANVEIPSITPRAAEHVHRRARELAKTRQCTRRDSLCRQGLRAARAQHPKLLKVLEGVAERINSTAEHQMGRTRRDSTTDFSERTEATELQIWREAYVTADRGTPDEAFTFIYAAAAEFCGLAY